MSWHGIYSHGGINMIKIFIPVLFICMNQHCEFLQAKRSYLTESKCWESINTKKVRMLEMVEKVEEGKISTLEGSCISAWTEDPKGRI